MAFQGWPAGAVTFFQGLAADNTKEYWTLRRPVYDADVRAPMEALLEELSGEFGRGHIARPYRDVRFRADKSPYKTSIYAMLESGCFVRFSAEGLTAARGRYEMDPADLDRYRSAVDDDARGTALAAIVDGLTGAGARVDGRENLKSAPRGYAKDHPRIDLLRHRGLIAWREWPVLPWLRTAETKSHIVGFLRAAAPLQGWLDDALGRP